MEHKNPYPRFFLMLATSLVAMYVVMYLNVYEWDHVYFSLTRVYMALLMLVPMTLIMMGFMWSMYPNKQRNALIMGGSLVAFVVVTIMVRSQTFVGDTLWMKAMIPHHSIAIMVSKRATIKDPEVRTLADSIISAQEREIGQMKRMLARLERERATK
jgi:intracellular septation protein A